MKGVEADRAVCMRFGFLDGKDFWGWRGEGVSRGGGRIFVDVYLVVVENPLEGVSIGRTYLDGNDISCVNIHGGVASCNLITIVGKAFRIGFVSNHTLYPS